MTIYLDTSADVDSIWLTPSLADRRGVVEERLADDLRDGWRVASVTACGWLAVVLEK